MVLLDKALQYAEDCVNGREITTWEVVEQCKIFLNDYHGRQYKDDFEFYFDEKKLKIINNLIKLMNFATGYNKGKSILPNLANFQAFLIANVFGWRFKNNPTKFRYNKFLLFISRKNAKGTICSIIVILLMLTEEDYSEMYSICFSKELASELRKQIAQIINNSPAIAKHFKVSKQWTGKIECKLTNSYYQPRTAEPNSNNSVRPALIVADETGGFTTRDNINAMLSGQLSVLNPLYFSTSSAYAESNSIMYEDLDYSRKVLNGEIDNPRYFCLIYYANNDEIWEDSGIYRANPLRIEANYNELREKRERCKIIKSEYEEFVTKNLNIMLESQMEEDLYLDKVLWDKQLRPKDKIYSKFNDREVSVAVDLSRTIDLSSVSIMTKIDGEIFGMSMGFIAEYQVNNENRREELNYYSEEQNGNIVIQKDRNTISVYAICEYIREIESKFNCKIKTIYYDGTYAEILEEQLGEEFDLVELRQTMSILSKYYKRFRDELYEGKIYIADNNVLNYCRSYAIVKTGTVGDILVTKNRKDKRARIDLIQTLAWCYAEYYIEDEPYDPISALDNCNW